MLFKENIKLLRKRKNRTQDVVAGELGFSRSTLNSYENGAVINPTVESLIAFSNYFKISIDTLLRVDLSRLGESKLRDLELGYDDYVKGTKLRVLATTVDSKNRENIELVPVKAKWVVLFYGAIELYEGIQNSAGDNVAHWAHIGGAVVGLLIVMTWNKTNKKNVVLNSLQNAKAH